MKEKLIRMLTKESESVSDRLKILKSLKIHYYKNDSEMKEKRKVRQEYNLLIEKKSILKELLLIESKLKEL